MMEEIKKQAQELIEQAYRRGFNTGYEEGKGQAWSEEVKKYEIEPDKKNEYIEQGQDEAWEAVKKIYFPINNGGLTGCELYKIFDVTCLSDILKKFSASDVVKKLRAYEERKKQEEDEIKVGDEVIINENTTSSFKPNVKAIVTMIDDTSCPYNVMISNGDTDWVDKDEICKTGRHFPELGELLKKLKEDK